MGKRIQTIEAEVGERSNTSGMRYWRQIDIVSTDALKAANIVLIGAGSVGSFTALALCKMGVEKISIYDNDTVEDHNLPNQFFRNGDVGQLKTVALVDIVNGMTEAQEVDGHIERWSLKNKPMQKCICISAVDSMKSRAEIWQGMKYNPNVELYIDSRMGAQVMEIISGNPSDPDYARFYEEHLFSDQESSPERCTEKSIVYNVMGIASFVCNNVKQFVMHQPISGHIIFDYETLEIMK